MADHVTPVSTPLPPTTIPNGYHEALVTAIAVLLAFSLSFLLFWTVQSESGDWTWGGGVTAVVLASAVGVLLWSLHRALSTHDDLPVHYRRTVRVFFRAVWIVAFAVLLAVVTMIDGSLTSYARAHESVKTFIRAGVVESYSCSPDAFVVVGPVWDTVRDDTRHGALDALTEVCSGSDMSVRRRK